MNKVIVIVGPTAIGKTKISIELAKRLNLDIISGDSVAVYKGLDIGSAKPTIEEMDGVKHYLIDVLDADKQYDVSEFQKSAREIIDDKKNLIICGGTGLYIQSVLYDYDFSSPKRDFLDEEKYKDYSNEELYNYLLKLNPNIDKDKLHMNNRKRVLRAIEILENNNEIKYDALKRPLYDAYIIYLNVSNRDLLYDRINKRVDKMMDDGLLDEVKSIQKYIVDDDLVNLAISLGRLNELSKSPNENVSKHLEDLIGYGVAFNVETRNSRNITIEDLDFSVRTFNCMKRAGCNTVADILKYNGEELNKVLHLGKKGPKEVITKMKRLGFEDWASKASEEIEAIERQTKIANLS